MEFELKHFVKGESSIYLLRYTDFDPNLLVKHLDAEEIERFIGFSSLKRKKEFVATRFLREQIFGKTSIHYDTVGAPYILNEGFISISHADNCVGLMLNKNFKVGLDLEDITPQAKRLQQKFLNENEKNKFDITCDKEMSMCWSAKEVLYKLAGRKGIDFKKELILLDKREQIENITLKGQINHHNNKLYTEIHIFESNNTLISFNTKALETTFK